MSARAILWLLLSLCLGAPPGAAAALAQTKPAEATRTTQKAKLDPSSKKRIGKASYYGRRFAGKTMANGAPMNPKANGAASRTLPLGTKAKVTNLENGRSAQVEITDRGPYAKGRIIDVSPATASKLNLKKKGTAAVEVAPIAGPRSDGRPKASDRPSEPAREKTE